MRSICFLLLVFIGHKAVAQSPSSEEFKKYTGDGFELMYPQSWELNTSKQYGAAVILFAPVEGSSDKFRENVNVLIQDLTGQQIDLAKYKAITDQQFSNLGPAIEVAESVVVNSTKGHVYRAKYKLKQGDFLMQLMAECYIKDEKAYLITFTAEVSQFEKYAEYCKKILDSFRVSK